MVHMLGKRDRYDVSPLHAEETIDTFISANTCAPVNTCRCPTSAPMVADLMQRIRKVMVNGGGRSVYIE